MGKVQRQSRQQFRIQRRANRPPLKDRPGWQKFKSFFPSIAKIGLNFVPGGGVISGLMETIKADSDTTPEKLAAAQEFLQTIELEEAEDDNEFDFHQLAREAELERLKSRDWLPRNITSLLAFVWTVFTIIILSLAITKTLNADKAIVMLAVNSVVNVLMLIIGYYFGSSDSSSKKNEMLKDKS